MTAIAAANGGHIGVVVDRVLEAHLFSISPLETTFVTIPDEHEDRRVLLDRAVVSTHPDVEDSVAALWATMHQYRGAQIERDTAALVERWLRG